MFVAKIDLLYCNSYFCLNKCSTTRQTWMVIWRLKNSLIEKPATYKLEFKVIEGKINYLEICHRKLNHKTQLRVKWIVRISSLKYFWLVGFLLCEKNRQFCRRFERDLQIKWNNIFFVLFPPFISLHFIPDFFKSWISNNLILILKV